MYIVSNSHSRSAIIFRKALEAICGEEEYKKSVEELFKDSGTPVLFMGEINDFGIYQNLEKEVSRILDFKEDEYLSLGAKKGMEYSRMVSKYSTERRISSFLGGTAAMLIWPPTLSSFS